MKSKTFSAAAIRLSVVFGVLTVCQAALATDPENPLQGESSNLRNAFYEKNAPDAAAMVGKVSIMLIEPAGDREVRVDYPFRTGDRFRFVVSSNLKGWLYIIHQSPSGKAQQLWPQTTHDGAMSDQEIKPGERYLIPPAPARFYFDEDVGLEDFIIAIRSQQKAPNLNLLASGALASNQGGIENKTSPKMKTTGNIIVRGNPFTGSATRSVFFDPGTNDTDPGLYFSAAPGDDATNAMVKFRLRHKQ